MLKTNLNNNLKQIINDEIKQIINETTSANDIKKILNEHKNKFHFIPSKYRVLNGILQSMNIKFGVLIEKLITRLILNENKYTIINYCNQRKIKLMINNDISDLINRYMNNCKTINDFNINKEFDNLLQQIIQINNNENNDGKYLNINKDVDLLFLDNQTNIYYYVEIKYNDDHDSGKMQNINRKIIETYSGLAKNLKIKNHSHLVPILFYFNHNKKIKNEYLPATVNILRGKEFFEKFLSINYEDVSSILKVISEDGTTYDLFNKLYENITTIKD